MRGRMSSLNVERMGRLNSVETLYEQGTKVYRVIDDGTCVLTTLDPAKALRKPQEILDSHDVTWGWMEEDTLS